MGSERGQSMRSSERRDQWYLLTGVLLGLGLGILIAWVIFPVRYIDTTPLSLSASYKELYRSLVAQAYQADGDLGRAQARLDLLKESNMMQVLADQAQRQVASKGPSQEARALAQLAADWQRNLNQPTGGETAQTQDEPKAGKTELAEVVPTESLEPDAAIQTPTPKPTATPTPQPSFTPRVEAGPSATPMAPFSLEDKREVCDERLSGALIQVQALSKGGDPVAGVQVNVTWDGGQDVFYTGLHPAANPGYADFAMNEKTTYSVRLGKEGELADKLKAHADCKKEDGSSYAGGWMLIFKQQ